MAAALAADVFESSQVSSVQFSCGCVGRDGVGERRREIKIKFFLSFFLLISDAAAAEPCMDASVSIYKIHLSQSSSSSSRNERKNCCWANIQSCTV